ncbi:sulfite exporter TauE/SafE family protein [Phycicoccus sp. CSK15P-2]|nr:sulfite exporter TauE/SafE family protein [Phycicoccus sp. CSK15P-2]
MGLAAALIGYSKTAIGGLGVLAVAIFAALLPARQSTAALLAVLIVGDLVAVWHYRRDADWTLVRRLLPAVLPGLALGSLFLGVVGDTTLRRAIGAVLLVLVALQLVVKWRARDTVSAVHERPAAAWGAGTAAGFATMTANAAGPVMTLYLSAAGIDKLRFVGTNAWFFLVVNLVKVPFSVGLGLLHWADAGRAALLAPLVVVGGLLGTATVRRISQRGFDVAVLVVSGLAALALFVG